MTERAAEVSAPHVAALDGVRGVAVTAVVLFHCMAPLGNDPLGSAVYKFICSGWIGVDIFFALSGYLITGILLDSCGRKKYFSSFFARRALRILPLYYGFLAILFLLATTVRLGSSAQRALLSEHALYYWLHLTNVVWASSGFTALPFGTSHFWSLAVEEQYYLVWPFVVRLLSKRSLGYLCIGIILGSPVLRLHAHVSFDVAWTAVYTLTWFRADVLAGGALLAVAVRSGERWRATLSLAPWVLLIATPLAFWVLLTSPGRGATIEALPIQTAGFSLVALAAVSFVEVARAGRVGFLRLFLRSRPLQSVGKYSYGMYVFHFPLVTTTHALGVTPHVVPLHLRPLIQPLYTIAVLLLSYGVAWLSWRLLEARFLALKRLFPRPAAQPGQEKHR